MILSEYTPARADVLNKLSIPETESPIPVKFLWLDVMDSADDGHKAYDGIHLHSFYEVHFVISGDISYECAGRTITVTQDHALLIPPGVPHRRSDNQGHFLKASFAFLPEFGKKSPLSLPTDQVLSFIYPRQIAEDIDRILQICDHNDMFSAYLVSSLCLCVFHAVLRSLGAEIPPRVHVDTDPRFEIAKTFIRNNKHRLIGCEDVAKECCLSSKQLTRIFKTHTGQTLFEYIMDQRYRYSQNLLLQSNATIKEIGYMLGFENESGFISFFKRQSGMSPHMFRKQGSAIEDVRYQGKDGG